MRRVKGGTKVIRGQMTTGSEEKIQLFDGKFTTGYKVVDFQLMANRPTNGDEASGKLCTEPKTNYGFQNFSDVEEIAWYNLNTPYSSASNAIGNQHGIIDPDNMVVMDLFVNTYNQEEASLVNYFIVLEKYEFATWDGAGTMVRNRSQAGPSS